MDNIELYRLLDLIVGLLTFVITFVWMWRRPDQRWLMLPVLIAGLVIVGFESILMYRYATWETCPPMCGLQNVSLAIRLYLGFTILLMSIVTGNKKLWRIEWNGTR